MLLKNVNNAQSHFSTRRSLRMVYHGHIFVPSTTAQLSKDDFTHKYLSFRPATIHLLDDVAVCSENPKYYVGHIFPVIPFHEFICFEAFNCAIVNWFMKE